jgi:hypothetical protein
MDYGERVLKNGLKGPDVRELQIRLAGFRGTLPDGDFGPGTELQVVRFQADFMKMARPSGEADGETLEAIDAFGAQYPLDFTALACPCGACGGFGQGRFKSRYRMPGSREEKYHRYEYPGIHRMLLWAVRGLFFYLPEHAFTITSGYRCAVRNEQTGRTSTNHHGKAVDLDVAAKPGEDKRDDMNRCNAIRGLLVERSNAQIGWHAANRKALEPDDIAPTWVHYDVRTYDRKYLTDADFCSTPEALDNRLPIGI